MFVRNKDVRADYFCPNVLFYYAAQINDALHRKGK